MSRTPIMRFLSAATFLLVAGAAIGQTAATTGLDLDSLFTDGAWNARSPAAASWIDGDHYAVLESGPLFDGALELVVYEAASGEREVVVEARALIPPFGATPLEIRDWTLAPDGRSVLIFTEARRVWRSDTRGDYWLYEIDSRRLRQIDPSAPPSSLMFAKFSPDGSRVAYVRENDLWLQDLRTDSVTRLTRDGSATLANGTTDWVYEEELGLRDGFRWSPDGSSIAFWQLDDELVREFVLIDNTSDLYPRLQRFPYPKAGEVNPAARVGVIPAGGGEITWMRLPGSARDNYVARMGWAANSRELVVQQLNRRQNINRVHLADASTGQTREVLRETDEAWVDVRDHLQWIDGGRAFTWSSERDGWRRLYRVDRVGRTVEPLTPAGVDVISLEEVDETGGWIWYRASPAEPTRAALYRAPLDPDPSRAERISPTSRPGTHGYSIAPGGRWALHDYSRFTSPPVYDLVSLPEHASLRTLEDNAELASRVADLGIGHELFRVPIAAGVQADGATAGDDGPGTGGDSPGNGATVELDAWALYPPGFDPDDENARYPVLFHVYGEPAGQTVLDRWGGRNLLWHHWLARQGWIVMSVDNRGTPAPRGREWRKVVYGEVGTLASEDQAAAVRAIAAAHPWVDLERIGVWGWSGGGSMTLNLLFRYPELYRTGMSVAPVADQRYYDTIYQERYMGTPQDNADGYTAGSPISYAGRLEGNLLLVHGTGDDNVHYQGTEALIDRLIEHGKDFSMMAYPNRTHSISEGAGTTRHLFGLLSRYLRENLPPGPGR